MAAHLPQCRFPLKFGPVHHPAAPAINPYRQLLRRRFPEPFIFVLVFVLGIWLWDNHFGRQIQPDSDADQRDTWELTLLKIDRDLRLADGLEDMPSWLRSLFGVESVDTAVHHAMKALRPMVIPKHRHDTSDELLELEREGAYALSVLTAVSEEASAAAGPFRTYGLAAPPSESEVSQRIIEGRESWWDMQYLMALERPEFDQFQKLHSVRTERLVGNMMKARGAVVALTLGGLVFVPGTLLAFLRARSKGPRINYTERWKASYGVGVFLLAFLAYLGFTVSFQTLLNQLAKGSHGGPLLSMPVYVALDSLTRFLPALLAIGLLFRHGKHAISRFGLRGPFNGKLVLGAFSILQILDFGLRVGFDRFSSGNPTGGLSPNEVGVWGLVLGVASACIAAPIAEEIVYRGVLFRSLANRLSLGSAAIVSSVAFSLVHFVPWTSLILIGVVGFMCAMTYAASRTLLTAIVLHALYNAAVKIPEWIIYQTPLF